jgi:hypothetical protein
VNESAGVAVGASRSRCPEKHNLIVKGDAESGSAVKIIASGAMPGDRLVLCRDSGTGTGRWRQVHPLPFALDRSGLDQRPLEGFAEPIVISANAPPAEHVDLAKEQFVNFDEPPRRGRGGCQTRCGSFSVELDIQMMNLKTGTSISFDEWSPRNRVERHLHRRTMNTATIALCLHDSPALDMWWQRRLA